MRAALIIYAFFLLQFAGPVYNLLECSDSSPCPGTATCSNNICKCPFGEVFNLDFTACLPISVGFDGVCEDDNQCVTLLGRHRCYENKCECDEGWRYYEGRCMKKTGFHEKCSTDKECFNGYDLLAMVCKDKVCSCNDGYYARGDYDCRPITTVTGPNDYCSLDLDCKLEKTACISSHCEAKVDITRRVSRERKDALITDEPSSNVLKTEIIIINQTKSYNKACTQDNECKDLDTANALCHPITKTCSCKRGYFLSDGKCIGELGQDIGCTKDDDCKIIPGKCINGKCYCRKTYFSAKNNRACQKPMTQDNVFCNNAERCQVYGTEVFCDSQNQCRCKATAELDEEFVCRPIKGATENCEEGKECSSITNSWCIDQKCQCKPNYRLENNACLPNIEASCDEGDLQCTIKNSFCGDNKICTCSNQFVAKEDRTECLAVATGLDDNCEIDAQCSTAVRNSYCAKDSCKCFDAYIPVNDSCYEQKLMGDLCTDVTQCHIMLKSRVQCRNSICQCSADMQPTENGLDCEPFGSSSSMYLQVGTIVLVITCHLILKLQFNIK